MFCLPYKHTKYRRHTNPNSRYDQNKIIISTDPGLLKIQHSHRFVAVVIQFLIPFVKHTNNDIFDDFPKISDHFPKISEDFSKLFRSLDEHFRTFFEHCRRFPKVTEDFRGGTDDVSIIQQHIRVLLLGDYVAIAMAILGLVTTTCYFHV